MDVATGLYSSLGSTVKWLIRSEIVGNLTGIVWIYVQGELAYRDELTANQDAEKEK